MSTHRSEVKKILFGGDSKVGKTQLLSRWLDSSFSEQYIDTIGVDYKTKIINPSLKFQIWDTAGQDRFKIPTSEFFKAANIFILVFSVTDQQSFINLKTHLAEARLHLSAEQPIVLLANKIDATMTRKVTMEEAKQFARENALHYYEISAKNGFKAEWFERKLLMLSPPTTPIQPQPLPKKSDLQQKIDRFKLNNPENEEIQAICTILETVINADTGSRQDHFHDQASLLKQHLDTLRWNFKSIVNTVMNLIATVFGLPLDYCCGCLEANKNANGDSWMFFKFGEYQASKVLCNKMLAEEQIHLRM